jgi:endonuclease YncB( thermonuclease family)
MRLMFALCLALIPAVPAGAETLTGRARVVDGDTLEIAADTVRLFGIDAPEHGQTCETADGTGWDCGAWAADELARRVRSQMLTCAGAERDRYGRLLATCTTAGADIAEGLVRDGVVFAYLKYSRRYLALEKQAAVAGAGLWQGRAARPEDFRAEEAKAAQVRAPGDAPSGCAIKGNISASGRIYHLPGQEDYDATRISAKRGERWFCSEDEAKAAGWRRARR